VKSGEQLPSEWFKLKKDFCIKPLPLAHQCQGLLYSEDLDLSGIIRFNPYAAGAQQN
jgi:hypothetical protein